MRLGRVAVLGLAWLAAAAVVAAPGSNRSGAGDWTTDGHDYEARRFSPLDRINEGNVKSLGLGWFYDLDTLRVRD
jgi:quinohemoprotein ethanol dehydrogenase